VKKPVSGPQAFEVHSPLDLMMWSGFSNFATEQFEHLKSGAPTQRERYQAAWALARKHLIEGNLAQAHRNLILAGQLSPGNRARLPFHIFNVEILRRSGRIQLARKAAAHALELAGEDSRLCFALANIGATTSDRLKWINRPLVLNNLASLRLRDPNEPLTIHNVTAFAKPEPGGPKISVIMPAYNSAETIESAARGILEQSHRNLELIIVDDCSPDDTWTVIQRIAASDPRVVPVRQEHNGGTYKARNAALRHATGDFITVNDADDWSHPQRLSTQLKQLLKKTRLTVNVSFGVRVTENLVGIVRPRSSLVVENTSSLMVPRQLMERVHGWDEVRFSADSELGFRLEKIAGGAQKVLKTVPLALILSREESLTNSGPTGLNSLRFGARREYKESATYWRTTSNDLRIVPGQRPFPVPQIVRTRDGGAISLDLLLVADFSVDQGRLSGLVRSLVAAGRRFGLFHLPHPENFDLDVHRYIRELIHDNRLPVIVTGETVSCRTVYVPIPNCLRALPDSPPTVLDCESVAMLEDEEALPDIFRRNAAAFGRDVVTLPAPAGLVLDRKNGESLVRALEIYESIADLQPGGEPVRQRIEQAFEALPSPLL